MEIPLLNVGSVTEKNLVCSYKLHLLLKINKHYKSNKFNKTCRCGGGADGLGAEQCVSRSRRFCVCVVGIVPVVPTT